MIKFLEDINVANSLISTNASNNKVYINDPSIVSEELNVNGTVQASSGFTVGSSGVSYTQFSNSAYIYASNGYDINLGGGIGSLQNDVLITRGKLYISSANNGTPSDPLHIKDVAANIRLESTSYYPNQKIDFRSSTASNAYIENNNYSQRLFVGRTTGSHVEYFDNYQELRAGGAGTHFIKIGATETKLSANMANDATFLLLQDYGFSVKVNTVPAINVGSGGSVDIGGVSQIEKLNVIGNILVPNNSYLKTNIPAGGSGYYTRIHGINSGNVEYIGSIDAITSGTIIGSKTNYLSLRTDESEAIRIDSNQNVGIGTSSPSQKLHVSSGDQSTARIRLSNTNTASGGDNIELVAGVHNVTQDGFSIYNASGGGTQFVIQGGGNVGIGTTSPSDTLHVVGTVLASSTMTASNFILSSDKRLKEKIKDLKPKHLNVKWKSFELKSEPGV